MSFGHLTSFLAPLQGIRQQSFGNSVINFYMSFGLYKFLASLPGIEGIYEINIQTKEGNTNLDILKEKEQK